MSNISNKEAERLSLDRRLAEGHITRAEYDRQIERSYTRGPGRRSNAAHIRQKIKLAEKLLAKGTVDQAEHDRLVAAANAELEAFAKAKEGGHTPPEKA